MPKEFNGVSVSCFLRDRHTCITLKSPKHRTSVLVWKPPPNGVLKMNFDGLSIGNPEPARFGCIV